MPHLLQAFIIASSVFRQSLSLSSNATSAQEGSSSRRQLRARGTRGISHDELAQHKDTVQFLLAKTKHLSIIDGSTVDGIRLHRAYAAAMR